jgi:hypothetical protein
MNYQNILLLTNVLLATPCWADVAGTWLVSMQGPGGTRTNELTIQNQNGAHFATMASPQGSMDIGEIQVNGNSLKFRFSRTFPGGEINMHYQGEVSGDQMTGTVTTMRGILPFQGVRQ